MLKGGGIMTLCLLVEVNADFSEAVLFDIEKQENTTVLLSKNDYESLSTITASTDEEIFLEIDMSKKQIVWNNQ
ncbi:hypothetical protein J8322_002781 [Listeria monocytogenes]|nr:hypothetical protein [Listeria monocytogenes]EFR2294701.1 hypothetical protein [Listeria monocytogenes]EHI1307453.1 hypothetical protein [Listeria monocytogenes]EHJ4857447.1 hypothetical protein [Listeria monocytogenes]EJN3031919.1 hypothetical protein [Listeria monocytogenes]